jgi:hypothetical protein
MLKRSAIFIAIVAAGIMSTAFFFGRPSIHFEKLEHDFGDVPENSEQTCVFIFYNKGKGTLVIEQVEAG